MGNCCGGQGIITGINYPRPIGSSKMSSRVLKNPDDWAERSLLLPHESARKSLFNLQRMYQYEHLQPQWKRKLFSEWYNMFVHEFMHEHHDLEEKIFVPWIKTKVPNLSDITTDIHQKLMANLNSFKTYFQTLATKKSISVKDIDVRKLSQFCELLNLHLQQEEELWVPVIRDNFTEEEHDALVGQIMQKAVNIGNVLTIVLDSMKDWCPEEILDQFINNLPPPLQEALPMFLSNFDQQNVRTISIICSGMEKEPVGYVWPTASKVTSRIIKTPKEWYEKTMLVPHEFVRRLMFNMQEMFTFENMQILWKRKLFSKWYSEIFYVLIHEHHDIEEKIFCPMLKEKVKNYHDIATEPHKKLLKTLNDLKTEFENLTTKPTINLKDVNIKQLNEFIEFMMSHLDQEEQNWPKLIKDHLTQAEEQAFIEKIMKSTARPDMLTAVFIDALKEWESPENFQIFVTKALPPFVQEALPNWSQDYENKGKKWVKLILSSYNDEPANLFDQQQ